MMFEVVLLCMTFFVISVCIILLSLTLSSTVKVRKKMAGAIAENQERMNLLSHENVKLREENEQLKERLVNLGFRDVNI